MAQTDFKPTYEFPEMDGKAKLRELILYIASRCEDDPTFNATKLNKILYWSDFTSYAQFREPITGVAYQKLKNGPAPKHLVPVREQMKAAGEIFVRPEKPFAYAAFPRHRIVPLREPKLDGFKARDIAIVDSFIQRCWGKTAEEVSDLSHTRIWDLLELRDLIAYEAVFLSDDDPSEAEIAHAHELIREHRWNV